MKISSKNMKTLVGKIVAAQHEEQGIARQNFIKKKENSQEVLEINQTILEAKEILNTLPEKIKNNYYIKNFLSNYTCWGKTIIELLFEDELNKLAKCNDSRDNIEFELAILSDSSETIVELIQKAEKKFKVKIS